MVWAIGLLVVAFACTVHAQDVPNLSQAGNFIQRQLDGTESIIITQREPFLFAQIFRYKSIKVSGCSMAVVVDSAFGGLDSAPSLRESYDFSLKTIDLSSFLVKKFFEAGLLEFGVTEPITTTSTDSKTKKVDTKKINMAQFRFPDVEIATRVQKAFARAAELCGAKRDVF